MNNYLFAQVAKHKFSMYNLEQCEYALADIRQTLALMGEDRDYTVKLQTERDAALDRIREIKSASDTKEKTIARILGQLNVTVGLDEIFDLHTDTIVELANKCYDAGRRSK